MIWTDQRKLIVRFPISLLTQFVHHILPSEQNESAVFSTLALTGLVTIREAGKSNFAGISIQAESDDLRDVNCTLPSNIAQ